MDEEAEEEEEEWEEWGLCCSLSKWLLAARNNKTNDDVDIENRQLTKLLSFPLDRQEVV